MTMHPSSGTPSMIDHIIPPRPQRSGSVHPLHPLLSPMYAPGVSDGHDEVVKLLGYRTHLALLCKLFPSRVAGGFGNIRPQPAPKKSPKGAGFEETQGGG